jgi:hypothetical protein
MVSVATEYLLASHSDVRDEHYSGGLRDIDGYFGLNEGRRSDFFPPSPHRGPWIPLLQHHAAKGLDFLINVFNHCADWYAHPRLDNPLEPAWEVELKFADGTKQKQWGNLRLWNLYRGTSVGPYALQSLLMALEKWLLDLARTQTEHLDNVLLHILRKSQSAALASVVAGVATAHPRASGEALLVLLSAPDYIKFDRARMASESQAAAISGFLPHMRPENKFYEAERKKSNELPHRRQDLESAIANLQVGPFASRVHAMLDAHLAALPAREQQNKEHRVWRLAIHRMDLRQYTISPLEAEAAAERSDESGKSYIRLDPKPPDEDVQVMVDESAAQWGAMQTTLSLVMWALHTFERKVGQHDPSRWREVLAQAKAIDPDVERSDRQVEVPDVGRNGPGIVAAVCVRDHWEEMGTEDQDWCIDLVCSEVLRRSNQWDRIERMQRFSMAADRACASVVPLLLRKNLTSQQLERVRQAFAAAITHPIEEVRWYSVHGIDEKFWMTDRRIALRCVDAIATEARLIDTAWAKEERVPYSQRGDMEQISAKVTSTVRSNFWPRTRFLRSDPIKDGAHKALDIFEWHGAEALGRILAIFGKAPHDPEAIAAFERAAAGLVQWWDSDDRGSRRRERDFASESAVSEVLQRFAMQTSDESAERILRPILDAVDRHPRHICSIVQGFTSSEDSNPNTAHYWFLWRLFAEAIKQARWISHFGDRHPSGTEMLSAIFLTLFWKDDVRHWRSLEGHAHNVHALFEALPPSAIVLDDYLRFLFHIGEQSLPQAFIRIADNLQRGTAQTMLRETNSVFLLEVLLQRHVYGRPLELKRDATLRRAVLFLLDVLVENGSSAAFRMRDDFVTPPG